MEFLGIPVWFLLANLTPFFNATVNVIDVYFAKGVYENEWDGAAVSCLFKITAVPGLMAYLLWSGVEQNLFTQVTALDHQLIGLAFVAGICYSLSSFFYFRAIMTGDEADVVLVESIFNLTAVLVPILAIVVLRQWLSGYQWAGVALAIFGAMVLVLRGQDFSKFGLRDVRTASMVMASIALSVCIVIEDHVYSQAPFVPVFAVFCLGCFAAGCFYATVRYFKRMENLWAYAKRFFLIFVAMETLELLGAFCQEGTISLTESFYISTIYCAQPVYALLISYALVGGWRVVETALNFLISLTFFFSVGLKKRLNGKVADVFRKLDALTAEVYADQRGYLLAKVVGVVLITVAVALVSFPVAQLDLILMQAGNALAWLDFNQFFYF